MQMVPFAPSMAQGTVHGAVTATWGGSAAGLYQEIASHR